MNRNDLKKSFANRLSSDLTQEETMGEVTHEQVKLMLQLYEMRREARMREAREWYFAGFHPASLEEVGKRLRWKPRKRFHAHGDQLFGNGREHRESRPD